MYHWVENTASVRKRILIQQQNEHYARYERMGTFRKWLHRLNCMSTSHGRAGR